MTSKVEQEKASHGLRLAREHVPRCQEALQAMTGSKGLPLADLLTAEKFSPVGKTQSIVWMMPTCMFDKRTLNRLE